MKARRIKISEPQEAINPKFCNRIENLESTANQLLNVAMDEEEERRIISNAEISLLEQIFQSIDEGQLVDISQKLESRLIFLIQEAEKINSSLKNKTSVDIPMQENEESYQLTTNKNRELLTYALTLIQQNPNFIIDLHQKGYQKAVPQGNQINIGKIANASDPNDNLANSYRSAVILILLTTLSIFKNKSISDLIEQDLSQIEVGMFNENSEIVQVQQGILQSKISPCIQTCYVCDLSLQEKFQHYQMFSKQHNGLYCGYNGYFFGGSDEKDQNKIHRFEDCSSAASKWLRTDRFSTADLQQCFENQNLPVNQQTIACREISRSVNIISSIEDIKPGDIICWRRWDLEQQKYVGGHMGVIVDIKLPNIGFMSYSRDVPKVEGMVYNTINLEDQSNNRKYMFFRQKEVGLSQEL